MNNYDVIIVGAGPAGLLSAYRLATESHLKVLVIDKGSDVHVRAEQMKLTAQKKFNVSPVLCGIGGAGGLSDGKLNLEPFIGGNLTDFTKTEKEAYDLIDYVDNVFVKFGASQEILYNKEEGMKLREKAAKVGVLYIPVRQKHVGSDMLIHVISRFKEFLIEKGVEFMLESEVHDLMIKDNCVEGIKIKNSSTDTESTDMKIVNAKYILLAPGRAGERWFIQIAQKYGIPLVYAGIDIGVRVETKYDIMSEVTKINWDPKFHIYTKSYDDFVRTFCTNPKGYVVKEDYGDKIGVNGHAMRNKKSENTNFAFLVRVNLTEPVENTHEYGQSIAHIATTIGGGKPILQCLGDLKKGRRSTWKRLKQSFVTPTLTDVTPGDIAMALPARIVENIKEGLERLDHLIKGIDSHHTLLYAPEIKYYSMRAKIKKNFESNVENLFLAGDGAGLTRDIINAAATGVMAADGIIAKK